MTDYNDGKWHGWNGGECPVHKKSEIEGYWRCDGNTSAGGALYNLAPAGSLNFFWDGGTKLQLFRVIKAYREPRETWLYRSPMGVIVECLPDAKGAWLSREVIE